MLCLLINQIHFSTILLFKRLPLFGFLIFQFKIAPTPLCLSRNKTKRYSGKNVTLTPTKTLPKKQNYSSIIFQTALSTYKLDLFFEKKKNTYKLDSQNKNTGFFFLLAKKQDHSTVNFQITLLNYKLDFQNKNMGFFKLKKKIFARYTVDFQITLSTYKLNYQNQKIICM